MVIAETGAGRAVPATALAAETATSANAKKKKTNRLRTKAESAVPAATNRAGAAK